MTTKILQNHSTNSVTNSRILCCLLSAITFLSSTILKVMNEGYKACPQKHRWESTKCPERWCPTVIAHSYHNVGSLWQPNSVHSRVQWHCYLGKRTCRVLKRIIRGLWYSTPWHHMPSTSPCCPLLFAFLILSTTSFFQTMCLQAHRSS